MAGLVGSVHASWSSLEIIFILLAQLGVFTQEIPLLSYLSRTHVDSCVSHTKLDRC